MRAAETRYNVSGLGLSTPLAVLRAGVLKADRVDAAPVCLSG
ncbi:MAG: hypothetical protein WC454_04285 [Phycisphaerae bacterium]